MYLDACLTGFGAAFANKVYALTIPLGFKNYTIVHLEILNKVVAMKIWGDIWENKAIDIKCDNMAVVEVLTSGRVRDPILATCARNIWLLTAIFNIHLTVTHIPGVQNQVADLLSRWKCIDSQVNTLSSLIPNCQWMPEHLDHTDLNERIYIACSLYCRCIATFFTVCSLGPGEAQDRVQTSHMAPIQ